MKNPDEVKSASAMLAGLINYCCETPEDAVELIVESVMDVMGMAEICPHCVVKHMVLHMRDELIAESGDDPIIAGLLQALDNDDGTVH